MDKAGFIEHAQNEGKHWWFLARRQIVLQLIAAVCDKTGNSQPNVLEVGCGTGGNVAAIATRYPASGVDISAHAVALARQQFPGQDFETYRRFREIEGRIASADLVLLLDVIEHVEDDFLLLSQLLEMMEPDARLLITVPADPSLWSQHDEALFHYRRYTSERLKAVWEGLPVECELFSGLNWRLAPIIRSVRWLNRFRRDSSTEASSDLSIPPWPLNGWLKSIFAGEGKNLCARMRAMDNRGRSSRGVSWVAVLRRLDGKIEVREKPRNVAGDQYDVPEFDLGIEAE